MKRLGRIPLPRQRSGAQGTKKGKRGYDRKRDKTRFQKEVRLVGGQAYQNR